MLVLSRRINQFIVIGDDITIRVLEINGSAVKLGIEAPRNVSVHRNEVYEKIKQYSSSTCCSSVDKNPLRNSANTD